MVICYNSLREEYFFSILTPLSMIYGILFPWTRIEIPGYSSESTKVLQSTGLPGNLHPAPCHFFLFFFKKVMPLKGYSLAHRVEQGWRSQPQTCRNRAHQRILSRPSVLAWPRLLRSFTLLYLTWVWFSRRDLDPAYPVPSQQPSGGQAFSKEKDPHR